MIWPPLSGFKDWRANWGIKQQKFPSTIVKLSSLFGFSKSRIVRVPPPGNSESRGQRQICCRMSTVATYAAAGAGLVFVGLYLVRWELLKYSSIQSYFNKKARKGKSRVCWTFQKWLSSSDQNNKQLKCKLDPVGSTVCYEMLKLCTGSV